MTAAARPAADRRQPPARDAPAAVVHVAPDPAGRGGMAAVVRDLLASPLAERRPLAVIVTHRRVGRLARVGIALAGLARLVAWCARHPDGIVHVHSAVRGSIYRKLGAVAVARAMGRPVLFHLHAGPGDIAAFAAAQPRWTRRLLRAGLRRASRVVSVSEAGAAALRQAFALDAVTVVPNAAPAPPAAPPEPVAGRVLYLGGFEDPAKGGTQLLDALARALPREPRLQVALAGPGEPPAQLRALGARAQWRGWLDEDAKRRALAEAAIVVLPSVSEGLPVALLEAMGWERAVVATRVGGIPEVVTDGVDGVLVAPGDAAALADALVALARDPARARALGRAARARVAAFDREALVERLDALYRSLRR